MINQQKVPLPADLTQKRSCVKRRGGEALLIVPHSACRAIQDLEMGVCSSVSLPLKEAIIAVAYASQLGLLLRGSFDGGSARLSLAS